MSQSTSIDYREKYEAAMAQVEHWQQACRSATAQVEELQGQVMDLSHQLDQLKKMIFGSRSERYVPTDPGVAQPTLFEQQQDPGKAVVSTQTVSYVKTKLAASDPKAHPGRMKLPAHLRRETVVLEPEQDISGCRKIGEDITEILECTPGQLYVKRFIRPKYAVAGTDTGSGTRVVMARLPERPLDKSMAGVSLLAQIIIDKYVDHLPLNRQMQRFSRDGVQLPITTLTGWVSSVCGLIAPLGEALTRQVLQSGYLHADETGIRVLDKDKKGSTHKGWFWVYQDSRQGMVFFDYQPSRNKDGPDRVLKDFSGYLQTDGYETYTHFDQQSSIRQLNCMAHARRKFVESLDNDTARSTYALEQIGLLYDLEREAKDCCVEDRLGLRQSKAVAILEELGTWMQKQYQQVTPKSAIGQALAYSIKRWDKLSLYTTDGILAIDNNPVERSIRPLAVGRKNYMFCGSHEAAKRAGMLYSLFGTCKLHQVNPQEWLMDVLNRISSHPINRIEELLPHIWCKQRSELKIV